MGRFSPTVLPVFPQKRSAFDDIRSGLELSLTLGEAIEARRDRKRRRSAEEEARELRDLRLAREGIFRGTAESPELTVDELAPETFELPDPRLDTDLADAQDRSRRLFARLPGEAGRGARERLGEPEPTVPGGGLVDGVAARLGQAARAGPPQPERRVEPGAFNPVRGTFEPALEVPQSRIAGFEESDQEQLTESFFVDRSRTPEAREAARRSQEIEDLVALGILEPEDAALAGPLDTSAIVTRRDRLAEKERERVEAEQDETANRAAYEQYVEQLRAVEPTAPVPGFDDRVNWVDQQLELARDVRNEVQIRTRPTRGAGPGGAEVLPDGRFAPMSPTQANDFLDDLARGIIDPEDRRAVFDFPAIARARLMQKATAGTLTQDDVEEALTEARREFGILSREERARKNAPFGFVGEREGRAPRDAARATPASEIQEARALVDGLPDSIARQSLREAGYTDDEIDEILE